MRLSVVALIVVAALGATTATRAEQAHARKLVWGNRYPVIGRLNKSQTLTGSWMPNVQVGYGLPLGEAELRVGGELGCFGFGAPGRWMGILGGAFAEIGGRPAPQIPVAVVLTARLQAGRVPVLTAWGLPMNYSGVFPGAGLRVRWEPSRSVSVGLGAEGLVIATYSWTGIAPGPVLDVTGSF